MLEIVFHLSGRVAYLQDHEAIAVGAPSYDRVICGILEHSTAPNMSICRQIHQGNGIEKDLLTCRACAPGRWNQL